MNPQLQNALERLQAADDMVKDAREYMLNAIDAVRQARDEIKSLAEAYESSASSEVDDQAGGAAGPVPSPSLREEEQE